MPSIFTLEGPNLGRGGLGDLIEYGRRARVASTSLYGALPACSSLACMNRLQCNSAGVCSCWQSGAKHSVPCQNLRRSSTPMVTLQGLRGAVSTGLGEMGQTTKDLLLVAGALGVVSIVALGGMKWAGKKLHLSGSRSRRRRRRR